MIYKNMAVGGANLGYGMQVNFGHDVLGDHYWIKNVSYAK